MEKREKSLVSDRRAFEGPFFLCSHVPHARAWSHYDAGDRDENGSVEWSSLVKSGGMWIGYWGLVLWM